uniref:Immunoglobulin V-set domain-containing protein n=1 Tax=Astyanax mexicanus TaxID=7994 RepID=A0A3B1IWB8_ASTMX
MRKGRLFMDVKVGRSAVLPCNWRTKLDDLANDQSPHIEWRTISKTVFERRGKEHYEGEGYKGRVDVPEDKLKKGNCSLVLNDVKAEDAGVYESYLLVNRENIRSEQRLSSKALFRLFIENSHAARRQNNTKQCFLFLFFLIRQLKLKLMISDC